MNKRTTATGIGILLVVVLAIILIGKLAQPDVPPEQQPPLLNETLTPPEQPDTDNLSAPPQENLSQPTQPTTTPPRKNYTLREGEPYIDIDVDQQEALDNGSFIHISVGLIAQDQQLLERVLASLNESEFHLTDIGIFYHWFSGDINKAGLEKLKKDRRVTSLEQERMQPPNR